MSEESEGRAAYGGTAQPITIVLHAGRLVVGILRVESRTMVKRMLRRYRVAISALSAAVLSSATAIAINVATDEPASIWPWAAVATLTILAGSLGKRVNDNNASPVSGSELNTEFAHAVELHALGHLTEAEAKLRWIWTMQECRLHKDHPEILAVRHELALTLKDRGLRDPALKEFQDVLHARGKTLGATHPSTFDTEREVTSLILGTDWL